MDAPAEQAPRRELYRSIWFRSGIGLAVAEAILIAVGVVPRWAAVVIAAATIVLYFLWGRSIDRPSARQAAWALALSQALVLFVPIVLWAIGAAVIVALAVAAAVVVVVLIFDR